jgi:hypothetical protein
MIHDSQGWGSGVTSRKEKTVQFLRPAHNKPYFQLLYSLINVHNLIMKLVGTWKNKEQEA